MHVTDSAPQPVDNLTSNPDDHRERYLAVEEIGSLKASLDGKMYRQGGKAINQAFYRLRPLVLIALTTGRRIVEIFA